MPTVTMKDIDIDEGKDFKDTSDKAEQRHCNVNQSRNTKLNGEGKPGLCVTQDGTPENQRWGVSHPSGSRIYLPPNGGVLLKATGNCMVLSQGDTQMLAQGNMDIVGGGYMQIYVPTLYIIGEVKIKGNVDIDGDVTMNNLAVEQNAGVNGNLGVGGNVAIGGDMSVQNITCASCSCC